MRHFNQRQESQEFYTAPKFMCLGFIVIVKKNDKLKYLKINLLSENLSQTAFKVVCSLKKLMDMNEFKSLDIKK